MKINAKSRLYASNTSILYEIDDATIKLDKALDTLRAVVKYTSTASAIDNEGKSVNIDFIENQLDQLDDSLDEAKKMIRMIERNLRRF